MTAGHIAGPDFWTPRIIRGVHTQWDKLNKSQAKPLKSLTFYRIHVSAPPFRSFSPRPNKVVDSLLLPDSKELPVYDGAEVAHAWELEGTLFAKGMLRGQEAPIRSPIDRPQVRESHTLNESAPSG
jgi:hypothetical protein